MKARAELISFVKKIICSSYGNLELKHECNGKTVVVSLETVLEVMDNQHLRDLRHEDHCYEGKGIVAKCKHCNQNFTTKDIINSSIQNVYDKLQKDKTCYSLP